MRGAPARVDLVGALAALAQDHRLAAFRLLSARGPAGMPAGAIAGQLAIAPSVLSFHLSQLVRAGLIQSWRAGRQIFYAANQTATETFLRFLVGDCCGGNPGLCADLAASLTTLREGTMTTPRIFNVLFLCTGNSARSIIAESLLRRLGAGKFNAFSAGSDPKGQVNAHAIEVLKAFNFPTDGLRSKSWSEFATPDAPNLDFVVTVCDNAEGEACPVWPGQPMTAHWGIPDPAAVDGTDLEKKRAFTEAYQAMHRRIGIFVSLPVSSLDEVSLQSRLRNIGQSGRAAEQKSTELSSVKST
jgi:ArsR family transcriptional regulator, arsenate/arsenite/antimonite-responsive transcriptional repressor / arsenate reductase (thioredoxin)